MATKRQRRKRRRRHATAEGRSAGPTRPASDSLPGQAARVKPRRSGPVALATGRADLADRPRALWGDFPLSELVVVVALILLVVGFVTGAAVTLGVGLVLGALAGVEIAGREHFAGYRSHNVVLAGAAGMTVFGLLFVLTTLSPAICIAAGVVAFGGAAWLLVAAFRRRTGGASYRLKA